MIAGRQRGTADTVTRGVVAVVGADPLSQVVVTAAPGPGAREVAVVGPLRDELGALYGAEVEVRGRAVVNGQPVPARAIEVASYEIVSVGGERLVVGVLEVKQGAPWLAGSRLVGAPAELSRAVGAKVWVVGRPSSGRLVVQTYGIIRAAQK